jgi:hypothetical protein
MMVGTGDNATFGDRKGDGKPDVSNAWGKQGWTAADLSKLNVAELKNALEMAWRMPCRRNSGAVDP